MTYETGTLKLKKIEIAEKLCQDLFNKPFDFKEIHKEDFFKVWEMVGHLVKMSKRYQENENATEENEF